MSSHEKTYIRTLITDYFDGKIKDSKQLVNLDSVSKEATKLFDDVVNAMIELWNAEDRFDEKIQAYYSDYLRVMQELLS